ncbi:transcription-repair coupling factor [Propionibacterium freudenreichii]|uniref:transcription-repair coupling factor n=1 Tax=Propionibacterium freudenreichii TaxID=1744 RepID=UPI0005CC14F4|nr:transcription-repair coupling factor [Propionibacterium freudenreichii]AJQ91361.1 Transcription-repair coupling factor [Propionibacterium freudenreichii subsp. freudenreichii]
MLQGLIDTVCNDPAIADAIEQARAGVPALDIAGPPATRAFITSGLVRRAGRPLLVVTSTFREAESLVDELSSLLGDEEVAYYPAWETLPHERLSPNSDTVGHRLEVLRRIAGKDDLPAPSVVVAPIRSVLQPQVRGLADLPVVKLRTAEDYDPSRLEADLVAAAYSRVDLVERRGEFAVRGGIVDIFAPTYSHPVRVDFFGDTIEDLRFFTVGDQRSTDETVDEFVAAPCRELLITPEVQQRAAALVDAHPELSEMLEKISQGQSVEGMEALIPALADGVELLVDVMAPETLTLVCDPELVRTRAADLVRTSQEFLHASWAAAAAGGKAPIDLAASSYQELADVRQHSLDIGQGWWSLSAFAAAPDSAPQGEDPTGESASAGESVSAADAAFAGGIPEMILDMEPLPGWRGDAEKAIATMTDDLARGWRVVSSVEGKGLANRMAEMLRDHDTPARVLDELPDEPEPHVVSIILSGLRHGFRAPDLKLTLVAAGDITNQPNADRSSRKMPTKRRNQVVPLELKPGDPLVHEQHGVGRFVEMTQRTVAGATREYMVIEYAASKRGQPGDRLYVPMDQLDQVTRYVGGEAPALDKMGGAEWKHRKSRARKAVRQVAAGLIKLYAARQASRGHAFSPDTPWQHEMEDAFRYEETPDQLACITDVKHDMEQIVPMDRLICGDVGYGKTEIAVRAAFKAVQDGKQVAVLVPTTLLVQQHYQTFAERYSGFPVTVAQLSRFQTEKEVATTLEEMAQGKVDVVIGTHRLLSSKVHYKDLGLVIIDEEQRFGVEHKEALKKLRVNVDVLSMSATPIPRTLEMAVTGIREMSTITTPPEERHPVLTFAGPYDEGQVLAAIRREMAREGQVFLVHNRVASIDRVAARIREMVPEARVVTAHGQMSEKTLEKVMVDFWERRADVLVCTTIVEAGLDIPTANTLIVDRADHMGLSQMHQLRGRVGRSRERGYAYFLYPGDRTLTTTAHDRLAALAANNELGAGMAIAMKDLEIRGAGNLLGDEQSGHIADVGFDLYLRLVGEAVAEFKGDGPGEEEKPMRIELPVNAHLPEDYVESERLRLEMYKRIAEVTSTDDIEALRGELQDRYGPVPEQAESLLTVAAFRLLCRQAGLTEVMSQGRSIRFAPIAGRRAPDGTELSLPDSRRVRLDRLYPGTLVKNAANLALVPAPRTAKVGGQPIIGDELIAWASGFVRDILLPDAPRRQGTAGNTAGDTVGATAGAAAG